MKKIICLLLTGIVFLMLVACGDSEDHIGEAKTPSASSVMKGRDVERVFLTLEERGFTNIQLEEIKDLTTGSLIEDGEVEKVIIDGNEDYSVDIWVPSDVEVIIYYHTFTSGENSAETGDDPHHSDVAEPQPSEIKRTPSKIKMPYSATDYYSEEWTLESLTEHFAALGFTNISTVACDPNEDNYRQNIFVLTIRSSLFSDDPWEAGEEFDVDDEITVYYNEFPLLTVDNCPDLVTVLTSKDMSYWSFATKYDGYYVEFDAYVTTHSTYDGGTSHIINVTGGDYDGNSTVGSYDPSSYDGIIIRIGDRTHGNDIALGVDEGDNVHVIGIIDESWSEYFKELYVESLYLGRR